MADIRKELDAISTAIYGEEVRGSIRTALEKTNAENEKTLEEADSTLKEAKKYANNASTHASNALTYANNASTHASNALTYANNAKIYSEQAAEGVAPYFDTYPFNIAGDATAVKNGIWRGKYLGIELSSKQLSQIQNGKFDDLFLGDYWICNDHRFRIVGFNCARVLNSKPHIVVMPDESYDLGPDFDKENGLRGDAEFFGNRGSGDADRPNIYDILNGNGGNTCYAREAFLSIFGQDHILSHFINAPIGMIVNTVTQDISFDVSGVLTTLAIPSIYNIMTVGNTTIINVYGKDAGCYYKGYDYKLFPAFRLNPALVGGGLSSSFYLILEVPYVSFDGVNMSNWYDCVYGLLQAGGRYALGASSTSIFLSTLSGVSYDKVTMRPYAAIG